MFPRRFKDPKTGFHMLSSMHAKKYMNKIGLEKEDYNFYKQIGKALLCSYTILGALWIYNGASPIEWWRMNSPMIKEKLDVEPVKEFIAKVQNMVESDNKDVGGRRKEMEKKKVDQEAQKMWLKMKNEVVAELREKGIDVK